MLKYQFQSSLNKNTIMIHQSLSQEQVDHLILKWSDGLSPIIYFFFTKHDFNTIFIYHSISLETELRYWYVLVSFHMVRLKLTLSQLCYVIAPWELRYALWSTTFTFLLHFFKKFWLKVKTHCFLFSIWIRLRYIIESV